MSELQYSDIIRSINFDKNNLLDEYSIEEFEKVYNFYGMNTIFSNFPDTIKIADMLNRARGIPGYIHYLVYLSLVRKKKRFAKINKAKVPREIEVISRFYKYSIPKAREISEFFTPEEIDEMENSLNYQT